VARFGRHQEVEHDRGGRREDLGIVDVARRRVDRPGEVFDLEIELPVGPCSIAPRVQP
jgi:hypothetical protein